MADTESKPQIVFVLGGPGAGKGTQCGKISEAFGFVHLSAGDLLRAERNSGSENGELISNYIKEGKIVPVEITVTLLKNAIEANAVKGKKYFLVDGFPRNEDNLSGWEKIMGELAVVRFVLFFDCPEKVMEARLLERGKTSGRSDDNIESIRKRFKTYEEATRPIIAKFGKLDQVRTIAADQSVDAVWAQVVELVKKEFPDAAKSTSSAPQRDLKSTFNKKLAALVRTAHDENKTTDDRQFWSLSQEKQKELVESAAKQVLFNPSQGEWSVENHKWYGGYTVHVNIKKDDVETHHSAYINSYGVLESWDSPLLAEYGYKIPEVAAKEAEDACCVM